MSGLKKDPELLVKQVHKFSVNGIKSLIKDIYDERKHNRSMSTSELDKLKKLEKAADQELRRRKVLDKKSENDYKEWKKKMDKEKRCY